MRRESLTDTRGVIRVDNFRAGSLHLRAHGCPDPDRQILRSRQPRKSAKVPRNTVRPDNARTRQQAIAAHVLDVERAYQAMLDAQHLCVEWRKEFATRAPEDYVAAARDARATYLKVSGTGPEGRAIEIDQGSETSPVRAV